MQVPMERWVDYSAEVPRYGKVANAIGESIHNMMKELRQLGVVDALFAFVNLVADVFGERHAEYSKLVGVQLATTGDATDFQGLAPRAIARFNEEYEVSVPRPCLCAGMNNR